MTTLPWEDLDIEVTAAGLVRILDRARQTPILETGAGPVRVAGLNYRWSDPAITIDSDEIEISYRLLPATGLRLTVRNTLAQVWTQRYIFENTTGESIDVEHAIQTFHAGPDCVAWLLGAGTAAALSVHPLSYGGPLLGARLQWGAVLTRQGQLAGQEQLDCGPFRLAGGARYIVQWRWERYLNPAAFARADPDWLPQDIVLVQGEPCWLSCPDAALVLPGGLRVAEAGGSSELSPESGVGCFPIEVRDVRGTARIELCWAPDLNQVMLPVAKAAQAGSRSRAGIAKLADAAAGLVVQRTLAESLMTDPEETADALDLLTDRVRRSDPSLAAGAGAGFGLLYLCGEYARTGEQDLLTDAMCIFTGMPLQPGIGLAAARLCLAMIAGGSDPMPVLAHIDRLAEDCRGDQGQSDPCRDGILTELRLVARVRPRTPGGMNDASGQDPVGMLGSVVKVGTQLGAGLHGARLPKLPLVQQAYLAAVLQATPDRINADLDRLWGMSAGSVATRVQRKLLVQLSAQGPLSDATAVLGWLALID